MRDHLTIFEEAENMIEIKKSEFISNLIPVKNEEQVEAVLEQIRKKHYKANHHCYAYIMGENSEQKKASDDGEPTGTAGKPILSVLENSGLTDVLGVVTRYFGGIKLGASGLTRAYSQATSECLKKSRLLKKIFCIEMIFECDYSFYGRLETYLIQNNIFIKDKAFAEKITLTVCVPEKEKERLVKDVVEMSNGKCVGNAAGEVYLDILED